MSARVAEPVSALVAALSRVVPLDDRPEDPEAVRVRHAKCVYLVKHCNLPEKDVHTVTTPGALKITSAVSVVAGFRDRAKVDASHRILVLGGPVGVGKTTAASWLIAQGPPRRYSFGAKPDDAWPADLHPRFVSAPEFALVDLYDRERMNALLCCSVLVLDDLGMEVMGDSGIVQGKLDLLFDARYRRLVWTVITTNLTPDAFRQRYGDRIVDRIREAGEFVGMPGESLRGRD